MRITAVTGHILSSPFTYGGPAGPGGNLHLRDIDTLLVRVETDAGITGWGEAFGFNLVRTTRQALTELIAPVCQGEAAGDIAGLVRRLQRRFHNFGRNGAVTFALSGLDIALWDIAAKAAGKPLHALLGGARRERVPAYASLLRYGDAGHVARNTAEAIRRGYRRIKLHEVDLGCIRAAREAAPAEVPLMLDINCAWDSVEQAVGFCRAVQGMNVRWVEEPVWPPEDFAALAQVRSKGGLNIAAGENACTEHQFRQMIEAGAVSHAQPSVIKVGGITEFVKVAGLADRLGVTIVPHCPYFGPGLLATLHLLATRDDGLVEMFYLKREACLWGGRVDVDASGHVAVPSGPGLGYEPDPGVMERYRVA